MKDKLQNERIGLHTYTTVYVTTIKTITCNFTASPLSSIQNCLQKYKPTTTYFHKTKEKTTLTST